MLGNFIIVFQFKLEVGYNILEDFRIKGFNIMAIKRMLLRIRELYV